MQDLEHGYGPTPEGAGHEHSDLDPAYGYKFGLWLAAAMIISAGIVYGTFQIFEGQMKARDEALQQFPLAAGRTPAPPPPRLQTQPFKDVHLLRLSEYETLNTYGWIDRDAGVVRVPIWDAMREVAARGLPTREDAPHDAFNTVVQESSSGRTVGVR
jgi:hypothetical protein